MCYAYKPVRDKDGRIYKIYKISARDFAKLDQAGHIIEKPDGYHYAKDTVGAMVFRESAFQTIPMRWDLIPRNYLAGEKDLSLEEIIKKKNSRAKNPATMKPWGFSSFNARAETISKLFSFKDSWREGKRCLMPVEAFKERPN